MFAWALSVMPVICPWWENGESTTTTGPFYCLTLRLCEGIIHFGLSPRSNVKLRFFLPSCLGLCARSKPAVRILSLLPANNPLPAPTAKSARVWLFLAIILPARVIASLPHVAHQCIREPFPAVFLSLVSVAKDSSWLTRFVRRESCNQFQRRV